MRGPSPLGHASADRRQQRSSNNPERALRGHRSCKGSEGCRYQETGRGGGGEARSREVEAACCRRGVFADAADATDAAHAAHATVGDGTASDAAPDAASDAASDAADAAAEAAPDASATLLCGRGSCLLFLHSILVTVSLCPQRSLV